jgi:hypothetical protein
MRQIGLNIFDLRRMGIAYVHSDCAADMRRQVQQQGRGVSAPGIQQDALGPNISHRLRFRGCGKDGGRTGST